MTITNLSNETILEQHADELALIREELGIEAAVHYANRLIDIREGIVAGDGVYYPRRLPDGSDPFAP